MLNAGKADKTAGASELSGLTFMVETFGCQMNKHDSERVDSMLQDRGLKTVLDPEKADIVVFLTCCVREKAETRLAGRVAALKNLSTPHGARIIAVGGCIGQRDGQKVTDALPFVDIVFGTHNVEELPDLLSEAAMQVGLADERPREKHAHIVAVEEESTSAGYEFPTHREHRFAAWLPIMKGCNNFCTYCIVPYVRGREMSRPLEDIRAEAYRLVDDGVREITLLGQNVNSYGRDLYGETRFAEVLREVGKTGVDRLRFATSHPKDLSDETIAAFAETPACMPQLHLPVQSGSDRILARMNRNYTIEHYLERIEAMRRAVPDIALSTDIIVGFPGEDEADFDDTLKLVEKVGYSQAFTFIFSKREGTPAATMVDDTPPSVVQERFDRLVAAVQDGAYAQNQKEADADVLVLVEGRSKRDDASMMGKSPKNQTVHFPIPCGVSAESLEGQIVRVHIENARTWYLSGQLVS